MSLDDAIEATLPNLRAQAESRMKSRCTIRRKGAPGTPRRGQTPYTWDVVGTDVPCRLKPAGSSKIRVGDVQREQATPELHLPESWSDLRDGDLIVLTAGRWTGSVLLVKEAEKGDDLTARRIPVTETSLPPELRDDWTP